MQKHIIVLLFCLCTAKCWMLTNGENDDEEKKDELPSPPKSFEVTDMEGFDANDTLPTVLITILVRNKAHTLPYFFGCLENLSYPKEKISLFIRSDHNVDKSNDMLEEWMSKTKKLYPDLNIRLDRKNEHYKEEVMIRDWVTERFQHMINLREEALTYARKTKQDFIFFVDADNLILQKDVLQLLMRYEKTLIAPMLSTSTEKNSGKHYTNWWGNISDDGFHYRGSPESDDIYFQRKRGLYKVAAVHSTFLIDLRSSESDLLTFRPTPSIYLGRLDDVVIFNFNARHHNISIWLTNEFDFGYLPSPFHPPNNLEAESYRHLRVQMQHLLIHPPMPTSKHISVVKPVKTKLGMDHIYVISLQNREAKRRSIQHIFDEWGIEAEFFNAVNGKALTKDDVKENEMKKCRDYRHYTTGRDLTFGEVGCFMSHHAVWNDALSKGYKRVMILEDDAAFVLGFMRKLKTRMMELENVQWDFLYLARSKVFRDAGEADVPMTDNWVHPSFNTWALHYVVSDTGLKKLVAQKPLTKLLPVDLYLPIMYGQYDDARVSRHFQPKNLVAFAAKEPLTYPALFWNDKHYISDAENGDVIPPDFIKDNDLFLKDEL